MSNPRSAPPELADFAFVRGIGGGGFADVFLYQQRRPNRPVAIKVLRAEHLSEESLRQFEVEADLMAEVSTHPYIVSIYAAHVAPDGRPYIVMEYYPQPHFGIRARGGKLPVAEVLQVAIQVCSAVETAHRSGIIHRDIKPANILTSAYNRPGLTDFGIAGVQHDGEADAANGVSIGYAAPEVLADERLAGSVAADVYSLGATIYSMLAGRSPFWIPGGDNSDNTLWSRVLGGQVPPTGRPDTPAALEHLLAQTLAREPASRPASALALARALQDVEQGLRLPPTPIEALQDAPAAVEPGRDDGEADGTRRGGARVVDPEPHEVVVPTPSPATSTAAAAPAQAWAPPPAVEEGPPTTQRPRVATTVPPVPAALVGAAAVPAEDRSDTVRRQQSTPPPSTATPDEPPGRSVPWAVVGGVAAAIAVLAVIVVTLGSGSGDTAEPDPTSPPQTLASLDVPAPPSEVTAELDDSGALTVSFAPPADTDDAQFQVTRTSSTEPWPDGQFAIITDEPELTIPGFEPGEPPAEICLQVETIRSGRLSEPTPETCVADTSDP